jgi:putative PIN family toxin of toxin-antitoxin system
MKNVVIDTNIIVSALLTKNPLAPTAQIIDAVMDGKLRPFHSTEIIDEYRKVLSRSHFHFNSGTVESVIAQFVAVGRSVIPAEPKGEKFPDPDDKVFYCTVLAALGDGAVLVTGNKRHFPDADFVLTPSEFVARYAPFM